MQIQLSGDNDKDLMKAASMHTYDFSQHTAGIPLRPQGSAVQHQKEQFSLSLKGDDDIKRTNTSEKGGDVIAASLVEEYPLMKEQSQKTPYQDQD